MSVSDCIPIQLYLQKQAIDWIWPVGHSLLTPSHCKKDAKIIRELNITSTNVMTAIKEIWTGSRETCLVRGGMEGKDALEKSLMLSCEEIKSGSRRFQAIEAAGSKAPRRKKYLLTIMS